MIEIEPIKNSFPVVKPKKIKTEDNRQEKQSPGKRQQDQQTKAEPLNHIDEIV
ncbi:MAG: hypothetical protein NTX38_12735 [Methylobacter sp.]|nr:hypothetical protein [Methylobacter sp.]